MTPRARSTRICTVIASCSTRPLMRSRNSGKRSRTTTCSWRRSSLKTFITTNWPANCGEFGYAIENKPRGDFEIQGISPALIEKFSKRHREIDQKTKELLAKEPEKARENIAAIRENIAHRERQPKVRDLALSRLQGLWDNQLSAPERDSLRKLRINE